METPLYIAYDPDGCGGVTITISHGTEPGGPLAAVLPLDHSGALIAAANILHRAGVERAEFEGGGIQEMTRHG